MRPSRRGKCRICLSETELTFEHIPPRAANNKSTTYFEIASDVYFEHAHKFVFSELKPKSRLHQGGLGGYFLCKDCNGFLGREYVRDFVSFSKQCLWALQNRPPFAKGLQLEFKDVNVFKVLKQITGIFICCNDEFFTEDYPELLEFLRNPDLEFLPDRYRYYMYLNNEGQIRGGHWNVVLGHGIICEFTFPPLGLVLSIDCPKRLDILFEITLFKKMRDVPRDTAHQLCLNILPTYFQIPLDYRSQDEIKRNFLI